MRGLPTPSLPRLAAVLALLAAAMATPLAAAPSPAYVAIDARSGEILTAHRADAPAHPASLAKLMTLYIAFEEIAAGRLNPRDPIVVSAAAAAMPASRLGLSAGDRISVADAISATAIRSANDASVALAEAISGDEGRFVTRMNATGRRLGLRSTVFRSASGLTRDDQISSAMDMAHLSLRMLADFPQYATLFAQRRVKLGGRMLDNTNQLLGRDGVFGLKTGYTQAAGYNLSAIAEQDGRWILVVAMGYPSADARDQRVLSLLREGFAQLARGERGVSGGSVGAPWTAPRPRPRPWRAGDGERLASNSASAAAPRMAPRIAPRPHPRPATPRRVASNDLATGVASGEFSTGSLGDATSSAGLEGWSVRFGAFDERSRADRMAAEARAFGWVRGPVLVAPALTPDGRVWRVHAVVSGPAEAARSCRIARAEGVACDASGP